MRKLHRWMSLIFILVLLGMFSYMFTSKGGDSMLMRCPGGQCLNDPIKVNVNALREDGEETQVTEKAVSVPPQVNETKPEKPEVNTQKISEAERLQKERHEHMQKFCGGKKAYDFNHFHYLIYNDQRKIIYCYVPKVACTQWKRIFMLFDGYKADNQLAIPQGKVHEGYSYKKLKNLPREEAIRRLKEYKKFMFVREPFERVISGYRDKLSKYNPYYSAVYGTQIIRKYRKDADQESLRKGHGVKFPEFVNFVIDGNLEEHWERQTTLCQPCAVDYDVLGHYETLQMDADYLLKIAGVEDIKFPEVHYTNTSKYLDEYYSKIPKEHIQRIKSVYQRDYDAFNFELPEVMKKFLN